MKSLIVALVFSIVSVSAFATEKACFGAKSDDQVSGEKFSVKITRKEVVVTDSETYEGTYSNAGDKVEGKDGNTYLDYNWGGEEGCQEVLVDEALLTLKGQGWIKFRCRGEGFSDAKFFCRNEK